MEYRKHKTKTARVENEILSYLLEYPNAQDTLEGIVDWWIMERRIKEQTAVVMEAVAALVTQGFVLEHQGKDSRLHYRIDQHKLAEIRTIVNETK